MSKDVIIVIDTDQYAGNFEREMTAYVTGILGECGVGNKYSRLAEEEFNDAERGEEPNPELVQYADWCQDHIVMNSEGDNSRCNRPCTIWTSRGASCQYNSVGIYADEIPDEAR